MNALHMALKRHITNPEIYLSYGDFLQIGKHLNFSYLNDLNSQKKAEHAYDMVKQVLFTGISCTEFLNGCKRRKKLYKTLKIYNIYHKPTKFLNYCEGYESDTDGEEFQSEDENYL